MGISQSSPTPFKQDGSLAITGDFLEEFAGFSIFHDRSQRDFNNLILAVGSETALFSSWLPVTGLDMPLIFQVKQCPQLGITLQNDMSAPAAISAVRPPLGYEFLPPEVCGARSTIP